MNIFNIDKSFALYVLTDVRNGLRSYSKMTSKNRLVVIVSYAACIFMRSTWVQVEGNLEVTLSQILLV